jgi:starvation-inducible outer membrane lipoprotein
MSSVSVPDPGEKIRLGARIIVAPTATRAAATIAKIEVDATARPYSRCAGQSRGCVDVATGSQML